MIAAVFKHAEKQMKILPVSPLPEKFRGAFVDAEREVLSEADCLKLIGLEDKNLSKTECIAKYCLILQLLTGMGYGDMKSLTREHCKFDTNHNRWYLIKRRNKTEEGFTVYLTPRAKYSFDRLRELSGGTETLFELPSIDYTNRTYKEIAKKAGVKLITTYLLRHTFAVSCLDNGTPLEDIQKMLGHKDLRTTQIYAKVSRKRLFEKISELEQRSRIHQL
jgi:integrase